MARDQRRLTAIVSADVVGYSHLMGRDESGTLAALKAHLREVIDPKLAEYGGRTVKSMGDGLLLEFPSVVDAVRCAVDVQRGISERNATVPEERRIVFRVGINVGDIIIDGEDIFGDGVNVAARLQTLAEPGGICVSRVVRDQVLDKLNFTFEDLGPQAVKNIIRPVEAYRVTFGGRQKPSTGRQVLDRRLRPRWATFGAGSILLVVVASAFLWWNTHRDAMPPPLAMSVAVLPFTTFGASDADERLADMLTKNVTTLLSQDYWTRVVAPGPGARYKGESSDPLRLGREFKVRYLALGELHRDGDKVAVLLHLVDAESGADAWSDRFEFDATQLEKEQTGAARRIQRRLYNGIYHAAMLYARKNPTLQDPWNMFLRAWDSYDAVNDASAVRKQFEEILRRDPNFEPALAAITPFIIMQLEEETNNAHIGLYLDDIDRFSSRAVALGANDSQAWKTRAFVLAWLGRWDEALAANARAQALDPSSVRRVLDRAQILILMGRPDEALHVTQRAQAMDPEMVNTADTNSISAVLCQSNLLLQRYREATPACEHVSASGADWRDQVMLSAVYAQQGEMAKAAVAKAATLKLKPAMTIARLKAVPRAGSPAYLELLETHYYAGLRKANFPEQ